MTPGIWDASQTRRTYDHRLREHVVRCGTMAVAKHVQIPRPTVSTWRRRGLRPVVTTEPFDQDKQNALDFSCHVYEGDRDDAVLRWGRQPKTGETESR
jgi:hypothetical protein